MTRKIETGFTAVDPDKANDSLELRICEAIAAAATAAMTIILPPNAKNVAPAFARALEAFAAALQDEIAPDERL